MLIAVATAVLSVSLLILAYHHVGYPMLLGWLARRARRAGSVPVAPATPDDAGLPSVTLIVPAHNEATVMVAKLANLSAIDYPRGKLAVVIALDGCTDDTRAIVTAALPRISARVDIRVVEHVRNIGKVAVLNAEIGKASAEIVALSDASASIEPDALRQLVAYFSDPTIGVVCPAYRLASAGSEGERAYWLYQTKIKADEAAVAAPMGAHGAFYLFRRALWSPLPADTINDDFVLPMAIVAAGYRAVYDSTIVATELERTRSDQEFRRRVRIGAGNMQQVVRLPALADPRRGALAFVFLSGKGLRPFVPAVAIIALASLAVLAAADAGMLYTAAFVGCGAAAGMVAYALADRKAALPKPVRWIAYLMEGYAASGLGTLRYLAGSHVSGWQPRPAGEAEWSFVDRSVERAKRAFDVTAALVVLAVLAVLVAPIALAIKLDSRGPVFYRQRRIGRRTPAVTETFELVKFRTMIDKAEASSGAVWAKDGDPRITRVGAFLRATRLDELPQCLNVLAGDMSMIGPRPERPELFPELEAQIPFYGERTVGLRPGITGLAQVNLPYDTCIDDVRDKCIYDHAYAARLGSMRQWLATDLGILAKTVGVVAMGKGR